MDSEKFSTLRKGLLEFLILGIVSSGRVYVADMMQRLSKTDFATQEGTLYPLLSKMRRDQLLDYEWQESETGPRASTTSWRQQAANSWRSFASTGNL
jgi:PadR family transcriptional regulator PadR